MNANFDASFYLPFLVQWHNVDRDILDNFFRVGNDETKREGERDESI
ncbi:MAG: hypothetical protein WC136_09955 [Sphaerochaeta sp.]|nr:hypothetical protein [Sphaerochaeta sp.]